MIVKCRLVIADCLIRHKYGGFASFILKYNPNESCYNPPDLRVTTKDLVQNNGANCQAQHVLRAAIGHPEWVPRYPKTLPNLREPYPPRHFIERTACPCVGTSISSNTVRAPKG
jgi:hypothetical protein